MHPLVHARIAPLANCIRHVRNPAAKSHDVVVELGLPLVAFCHDRLALTDHRCGHQSCVLKSSWWTVANPSASRLLGSLQGDTSLLHRSVVPTFFSMNRPAYTASCAQSHLTSRCRTRPDPIRLCMLFAVLSVSTSVSTFRPVLARL